MRPAPRWDVEGRDWPNRAASRFVTAAGFNWHVQEMGHGPALLLVHGTGAATHSWRGVAPILSKHFTVVAPDLPGHGFSEMPRQQMSLPNVASMLAELLAVLKVRPRAVVGHSAGAAIVLRMALDRSIRPHAAVSLGGALAPFRGASGMIFHGLAKLLFLNPLAARLMAWRAESPAAVARVIESTGSRLDAEGLALYGRLLRTERHVHAALALMANWDLLPLRRDLRTLAVPLTLIAPARDRAVPPSVAQEASRIVPRGRVVTVPGLGHLAHEESPGLLAQIIEEGCAF